jgi:hypothetical protein
VGIQTFRLSGRITNGRLIGGYELGVIDGVTVCIADNPSGCWFWVAGDSIAPTGPIPAEEPLTPTPCTSSRLIGTPCQQETQKMRGGGARHR